MRTPGDAIDFETREGDKLKQFLVTRLETLRRENDSSTLDAVRTAEKRGRIAEVKFLLTGPAPVLPAMPSYGATRTGGFNG